MELKYRLLRFAHQWIIDKIKKDHLDRHKNDIKCDNCNEWYSVSGVRYKHSIKAVDFGYETRCGQCGYKSCWNSMIAPVLIRCDQNGSPIDDGECKSSD